MAREIIQIKNFKGGISSSEKEGVTASFLWAEKLDFRTDQTKLTLLPRTAKVSGTILADLPLDATRYSTDTYLYGNAGHIYKRTSAEVWSDLHTVNDSHGNGIMYFGEDGYTYYTSDTVIGRYGPMSGTAQFVDDYFGSQGGTPANTHSLDLEASSSQYATAADSATLSITSDMSIEADVKWESLPTVGNSMTIVSKWDGLSDERSYRFDIAGVSAKFGDGGDGALTISGNTTDAPTDSACTGTSGSTSLSATNASFATGQKILIHQSRGTNAGRWERNEISSYTAGTITTTDALTNTYTSGAQVLVLKEYTNVTVNNGVTWTAKAWSGTVGGILAFLASGTVTVTGTISANGGSGSTAGGTSSASGGSGGGFRGGDGTYGSYSQCGEGTTGAAANQATNNGNGGAGGYVPGTGADKNVGGGGGGNGTVGSDGQVGSGGCSGGAGGTAAGSSDLTTLVFGGGGGGGATLNTTSTERGGGGSGGGIVFITGATVTITGAITVNGGDGGDNPSGGGGGGGGSVLLKAQTATLGSGLITASGGTKGTGPTRDGGNGAIGRVHLDYYTSYTGTTTPTLDVVQDSSLVTTTTYQLRFWVSTDGTTTNQETLSKTLSVDPTLSVWYRYAVTWDASASTATFYKDGVNLGTAVGAKTSIYNSTALLAIGANFNAAGAAENFLDGKVDDVRVFDDLRSDNELNLFKETEIAGGTADLNAYYQVDNSTADSTANANTLTLVNSPVYSTDVPFPATSARQDLDQGLDTSGQTETLPTAIDEGATNRQTFVPAKDPQKSVEVNISAKGTGDWTLTVHDALNRTIASKTVVNADLPASGDYEFTFSSVWRPVLGQTYHFHITSTVADGVVITTTLNDLETVDFHTYYQFLVESNFHPIEHHIEKLCIGNERYLATYDGVTYNPHALTLPSGYNIRCLGIWREYIAMGITLGTNIYDYDRGYIFFWDGYSDTYNFYITVPQGGINSMVSGDPLYFVAGYTGDLMKYEGGKPRKIRRMPFASTKKYIDIAPHALTTWRSLLHIGMAYNTDSSDVYQGVYSYGTLNDGIAETLSFDYPTSTSVTQDTGLKIGLVYPVGDTLLISWQYGTSYGVDAVKPTNNPFTEGKYQTLITDAGKIYQEKQALTMRGLFKALESGDSIKLSYKIDRESVWTDGTAVTTADAKEARLLLPTTGGRFDEFQMQTTISTTNSTSPEFYGMGLEYEDMTRERRT